MGNAGTLRELNKNKVLNTIKQKQPLSRTDLATCTGLALPTILRIVDGLLHEGVVVESGKSDTLSGRKPILLNINSQFGYFIGIYIGLDLVAVLTDFEGKILGKKTLAVGPKPEPDQTARKIQKMVDGLIANKGIERKSVLRIGVARPGMGFKSGDLISSSVFAGWDKIDFDALINEYIQDIPVVSSNITNCGLLGEQRFGRLASANDAVFITVGNGVGGAAMINGRLYQGKDDFAGHIGHQIIKYDGEYCYCGNRGCLETYASISGILKRLHGLLEEAGQDALSGGEELTFEWVVKNLRAGNPLCKQAVREAGAIMGVGLANVINMLNPERIVFGGDVSINCPEYVESAVETARPLVFSEKASRVDIRVSKIDRFPEALGAVAFCMNHIYEMPELE